MGKRKKQIEGTEKGIQRRKRKGYKEHKKEKGEREEAMVLYTIWERDRLIKAAERKIGYLAWRKRETATDREKDSTER